MNQYAMLILSQIMIGSVAVFARWTHLPADLIVLFRCFFAAICIGVVLMLSTSLRPYLKWNKTLLLLVATGTFMAANWYFFFQAVLTTTITNSILLYNFAPIFVLLSATFFLSEVPTLRQAACVLTSIAGVGMILSHQGLQFSAIDQGCIYALLAGALYSQVTIIGRLLKAVPAPVVSLFQTMVGAVLFLPFSFKHLQTVQITSHSWMLLACVGLFHTAVPYLMYFKALQSVKATVAGIAQYIYTLSSIIFGVIFFKESVDAMTILGGAFIIVSSFIAIKFPGKTPLISKAREVANA